jgi:hypothetical protein
MKMSKIWRKKQWRWRNQRISSSSAVMQPMSAANGENVMTINNANINVIWLMSGNVWLSAGCQLSANVGWRWPANGQPAGG